jgi:hypothetical protein
VEKLFSRLVWPASAFALWLSERFLHRESPAAAFLEANLSRGAAMMT